MSAVGVSVGNTVMIRYISIVLITTMLFFYNKVHQYRTYTNKEREKVLHFLAFNLLLSRDGLYQTDEFNNNNLTNQESIIKKLQLELSSQIEVKRFINFQPSVDIDSNKDNFDDLQNNVELQQHPRIQKSLSTDPTRSNSSSQRISSTASKSSKHELDPLKLHPSKEIVINPLSSPSSLISPPSSPRTSSQDNNP